MILIDMPMPVNCEDCPCSHTVTMGELSGKLICCAMEARGDELVIVEEFAPMRPDRCPIKLEIIK